MSFCSLLTSPPDMLHLVLGIHRLLIRGVVQLASDKFGSKLNDLASGLKEVGFTRMSVKITALLNTCDSKLTTIANVCSHIAPNGNEGRLLEMRVGKLFEVLFYDTESTSHIKGRKRAKPIIFAYCLLAKISDFFMTKKATLAQLDNASILISKLKATLRDSIVEQELKNSVYFHVLEQDVVRYARFYIENLGVNLGIFWAAVGEHCNYRVKREVMEHSNFSRDCCKQIIFRKQVRFFHVHDSCVLKSRTKFTCTSCGTPWHMKSNRMCPNHAKTGVFNYKTFSIDFPFTKEEESIMESLYASRGS